MKLQATVKLNLPSSKNIMRIVYNTYEKATYDQYLIASLVSNVDSIKEANNYIDDLTGQGSLNSHFKLLYLETAKLSKEEIDKILDSSLFPIQKEDVKNVYKYYPSLDISIMNKTIYKGNLKNNKFLPQTLVTEGEFIRCEIDEKDVNSRVDAYMIKINDNKIEILLNDNWVEIEEELFKNILVHEVESIEGYQGKLSELIENKQWNLLTNSKLNNMLQADNFYIQDGNHYQITRMGVTKTIVSNAFGIYLYNEIKFDYTPNNKEICEQVIKTMIENSKINEFKTKVLLDILKVVSDSLSQEVINYLLIRKESKELSIFGLNLVFNGLEKGWHWETINEFKKFADSRKELFYVYRLNNELNFSIEELVKIYQFDRTILINEHLNQVEDYYKNINEMKNNIKNIYGEIMASGTREETSKLKNTPEIKSFRKSINKFIAHNKKNIDEMSFEQITNLHKEALEMSEANKKMLLIIKNYNE